MRKPRAPRDGPKQNLTALVWAILALYVLVGFVVTMTSPNFGLAMFAAFGLYVFASFKTVDSHEQALRTVFGSPIKAVPSGLYFCPLGMTGLVKLPTTLIHLDIGTSATDHEGKLLDIKIDPSTLYMRGSGEPQRITFAPHVKRKENSNDPLNSSTLTCDPRIVALMEIDSPEDFVRTIGSIAALVLKVEEIAVSSLQELCATRTAAQALADLPLLGVLIQVRIENLMGDRNPRKMPRDASKDDRRIVNKHAIVNGRCWGINFRGLTIKTLGFPRRVNDAIAENQKAGFARLATITTSEGERIKRQNEGLGDAEAQRQLLYAKADGFAEQAITAETPGGQFALQQSTIAETMKTAQHTLIADQRSLLGAIAAGREVLQRVGGPERAAPEGQQQQGGGQQRQQRGRGQGRQQRDQERRERRGQGGGQGQQRQGQGQNQPAQAQAAAPEIQAHGELVPPAAAGENPAEQP